MPVAAPGLLLIALIFLLRFHPAASRWAGMPLLQHMGYLLLALAAGMGLAFGQSRAVFIAGWLALSTVLLRRALGATEPESTRLLWLLISTTTPLLVAVLYRLRERGLFSAYGISRIAIVLAGGVGLVALLRSDALIRAVAQSGNVLLRPASAALPVPLAGLIVLVLCLPLLLLAMPRESPLLGPLLLWVLLFQLGALGATSRGWPRALQASVFLCMSTGAALTLALAVIESAWRHAHLDELTRLANRRAFTNHLSRLGNAYVIAMVDIDHFKAVNDQHGHDTGDQVLRFVAGEIGRMRAGTAYRYGGEEFAVIFEGWSLEAAREVVETLRIRIAERRFHVRGKGRPRKAPNGKVAAGDRKATRRWTKAIALTISGGLAQQSDKYPTPQQVIKAADQALYRAKNGGRNQVLAARG